VGLRRRKSHLGLDDVQDADHTSAPSVDTRSYMVSDVNSWIQTNKEGLRSRRSSHLNVIGFTQRLEEQL